MPTFIMKRLWRSIDNFCKDALLSQIVLNAASVLQFGGPFMGPFEIKNTREFFEN